MQAEVKSELSARAATSYVRRSSPENGLLHFAGAFSPPPPPVVAVGPAAAEAGVMASSSYGCLPI